MGRSRSNFSFSPAGTLWVVDRPATFLPPSVSVQVNVIGSPNRVLLKMPNVRVALRPEAKVQSH